VSERWIVRWKQEDMDGRMVNCQLEFGSREEANTFISEKKMSAFYLGKPLEVIEIRKEADAE